MTEAEVGRLEERIKAERELRDLQYRELYRSIELAAQSLDKRLESMNEFRAQILSERSGFVTKHELGLIMDKIEAKLQPLTNKKSWAEGRDWTLGVVVIIGSAIVTLLGNWLL